MKDFIKYIGIFFIRTIVRFFYIAPVKEDRVIISCYLGTQYAGSPKVISEYIREWGKGKYEIIWAFKNKDDFAFLKGYGIKTVGYYSVKRLFLEATAKYCIDNAAGCFGWFPSRKGQYHIDTWHGGGCYKTDGILEKRGKFALKRLLFHIHETMLMYGKEANNRKQEIDRQHHTIPNQRPKDKHYGNVHNRLWNHG